MGLDLFKNVSALTKGQFQQKNIHLLLKWKYHCTVDLLFYKPICLVSAALLVLNEQQIYLEGQIQTS